MSFKLQKTPIHNPQLGLLHVVLADFGAQGETKVAYFTNLLAAKEYVVAVNNGIKEK